MTGKEIWGRDRWSPKGTEEMVGVAINGGEGGPVCSHESDKEERGKKGGAGKRGRTEKEQEKAKMQL